MHSIRIQRNFPFWWISIMFLKVINFTQIQIQNFIRKYWGQMNCWHYCSKDLEDPDFKPDRVSFIWLLDLESLEKEAWNKHLVSKIGTIQDHFLWLIMKILKPIFQYQLLWIMEVKGKNWVAIVTAWGSSLPRVTSF